MIFSAQVRRQVFGGLLEIANAEFKALVLVKTFAAHQLLEALDRLAPFLGLLEFATDLIEHAIDNLHVDVAQEIEQRFVP